jgi:surfeit locus 1 family protein
MPAAGGAVKRSRLVFLPWVAAAAAIVLFISLGFWQLRRADEKRALQEAYDRRATQTEVTVDATVRPAQALQFHRVTASGTYETGYQVLLDNRMHQGAAGYHVITPLRIAGSETRVLVNRGWIGQGPNRAQLPVIDPPTGGVTVRGIATVPQAGLLLGQLSPLSPQGPTVWAQFDLAGYAAQVPFPIQPVLVLLDPASAAGGFERQWTRLDSGIAVHYGYAFQWFALAVATLVLSVVLTVRAYRRGESS